MTKWTKEKTGLGTMHTMEMDSARSIWESGGEFTCEMYEAGRWTRKLFHALESAKAHAEAAQIADDKRTADEAESVAAQIAAKFTDGTRFTSRSGDTLTELCEWNCKHSEPTSDRSHRWTFADGSAIVIHGDCWDLGFSECWCMAGNGHGEDCISA
jgi:hypothetical protein